MSTPTPTPDVVIVDCGSGQTTARPMTSTEQTAFQAHLAVIQADHQRGVGQFAQQRAALQSAIGSNPGLAALVQIMGVLS